MPSHSSVQLVCHDYFAKYVFSSRKPCVTKKIDIFFVTDCAVPVHKKLQNGRTTCSVIMIYRFAATNGPHFMSAVYCHNCTHMRSFTSTVMIRLFQNPGALYCHIYSSSFSWKNQPAPWCCLNCVSSIPAHTVHANCLQNLTYLSMHQIYHKIPAKFSGTTDESANCIQNVSRRHSYSLITILTHCAFKPQLLSQTLNQHTWKKVANTESVSTGILHNLRRNNAYRTSKL